MNTGNISNVHDDGSLSLFLYEEIGMGGVSGAMFAQELNFHIENGVKKVLVHINSPGGLIQDGLSIIGAIRAAQAHGVEVNTINDGIAASIAGVIFLHGTKRLMLDYAKIMIHAPSFATQDVSTISTAEQTALKQIQDTLAHQFANNSGDHMSKDDFMAIMDREIWVDPTLALNWGIIDEIVDTGRESGVLINNTITAMYNQATVMLASNSTTPFLNQIDNQMKDVKNHLNLDEAANEESVLSAIKNQEEALQTAATSLTEAEESIVAKDKEIEELKAANEAFKVTEAATLDTEIVNFVDAAIEAGKYGKDSKDSLLTTARNGFDGFKTITNSINVSGHVDITDGLTNLADAEISAEDGKVDGKTLRDLEKTDPRKLETIRNEQPDLYAKMHKHQYGVAIK